MCACFHDEPSGVERDGKLAFKWKYKAGDVIVTLGYPSLVLNHSETFVMVSRTLLYSLFLFGANAVHSAVKGTGSTTRGWSCCKNSCSWANKAPVNKPVLSCDAQNNPLINPARRDGCESGGTIWCPTRVYLLTQDQEERSPVLTSVRGLLAMILRTGGLASTLPPATKARGAAPVTRQSSITNKHS